MSDHAELVERLREYCATAGFVAGVPVTEAVPLALDAADTIAALVAERDALYKAGIETAAALAQRKPLHALSHLSEASHIGHRQFARAYGQADDDTRLMAIALRDAIDAARTQGQEPGK